MLQYSPAGLLIYTRALVLLLLLLLKYSLAGLLLLNLICTSSLAHYSSRIVACAYSILVLQCVTAGLLCALHTTVHQSILMYFWTICTSALLNQIYSVEEHYCHVQYPHKFSSLLSTTCLKRFVHIPCIQMLTSLYIQLNQRKKECSLLLVNES